MVHIGSSCSTHWCNQLKVKARGVGFYSPGSTNSGPLKLDRQIGRGEEQNKGVKFIHYYFFKWFTGVSS